MIFNFKFKYLPLRLIEKKTLRTLETFSVYVSLKANIMLYNIFLAHIILITLFFYFIRWYNIQ